jgi:hypothetical protein
VTQQADTNLSSGASSSSVVTVINSGHSQPNNHHEHFHSKIISPSLLSSAPVDAIVNAEEPFLPTTLFMEAIQTDASVPESVFAQPRTHIIKRGSMGSEDFNTSVTSEDGGYVNVSDAFNMSESSEDEDDAEQLQSNTQLDICINNSSNNNERLANDNADKSILLASIGISEGDTISNLRSFSRTILQCPINTRPIAVSSEALIDPFNITPTNSHHLITFVRTWIQCNGQPTETAVVSEVPLQAVFTVVTNLNSAQFQSFAQWVVSTNPETDMDFEMWLSDTTTTTTCAHQPSSLSASTEQSRKHLESAIGNNNRSPNVSLRTTPRLSTTPRDMKPTPAFLSRPRF